LKNELVHPADALSKALDRTSGLLSVLTDLYETQSESFSGGNPFVVHALSTAAMLVAEARKSLNDLHYSCDLTLLDHPGQGDMVLDSGRPVTTSETTNSHVEPVRMSGETSDTEAVEIPIQSARAVETARDEKHEEFAESYSELLKKLTAAEVFAAEQQALSVPGASPELLPLLRSLREDLQKIHSAA
jgi:hypothetical protein